MIEPERCTTACTVVDSNNSCSQTRSYFATAAASRLRPPGPPPARAMRPWPQRLRPCFSAPLPPPAPPSRRPRPRRPRPAARAAASHAAASTPATTVDPASDALVVLLPRRPRGRAVGSAAFAAELARLRALSACAASGVTAAALAGADEVGAGALAGPLVAAAVSLPSGLLFEGLDDSKRVPPARRRAVAAALRATPAVRLAVAAVPAAAVDRLGVGAARVRAIEAAAAALAGAADTARTHPLERLLVDGDRAPDKARCGLRADAAVVPIVGGDAKCACVAAASVVAKVARDEMMTEAAAVYPAYGFERNMAYGTKEHLDALRTHGPCPEHRRSYRPVREAQALCISDGGSAQVAALYSAASVEWVD